MIGQSADKPLNNTIVIMTDLMECQENIMCCMGESQRLLWRVLLKSSTWYSPDHNNLNDWTVKTVVVWPLPMVLQHIRLHI